MLNPEIWLNSISELRTRNEIYRKVLIQPRSPHKSSTNSKYDSNTNSSRKVSLFLYLGLGLCPNQPLAFSRYISLHVTTRVAHHFYFYVLCKHYHTNKDKVVLDNLYSLQVLHTTQYGVVLGNPIQYSQRDTNLREYRIIFPL